MSAQKYAGRVGLQQRVLPAYRVPFFEALAAACEGGLSVFAGRALPEEAVREAAQLENARLFPARNRNFFPIRSPIYHCWQSGIQRWLETWQPEALVVEANSRNLSSRLACRWMHARGRPVIGWGLGSPPMAARGVLGRLVLPFRRLERQTFLRSLDALVAYSQAGADEYRRLGFPAERVRVAPNAAAPRPAGLPPLRPARFSDRPVVLFVGRIQARKRLDQLLSACAALPAGLQPRLVVVGDGPALPELKAQAEEQYPQAEFPGARHGADLEPFYAAADLFVLPGTGGLAVQQAMAHGLPVLVAEGDGTQNDLVREPSASTRGNGWLIPPGDQAALQTVLAEALRDPVRLRQMGAESYRVVVEEVNIEGMVSAFVDLFIDLKSSLGYGT